MCLSPARLSYKCIPTPPHHASSPSSSAPVSSSPSPTAPAAHSAPMLPAARRSGAAVGRARAGPSSPGPSPPAAPALCPGGTGAPTAGEGTRAPAGTAGGAGRIIFDNNAASAASTVRALRSACPARAARRVSARAPAPPRALWRANLRERCAREPREHGHAVCRAGLRTFRGVRGESKLLGRGTRAARREKSLPVA